jgi:DNA-binding GntR family transcriptional regulator
MSALKVTLKSLEDQATDAIRGEILSGRFSPGSRLTEQSLVDEMGLSRGTVRGALQQLSFEGLVHLTPFRGWSVVTLTSSDAWEIYTLRNALEGLASRILAQRIDSRKSVELDEAFRQLVATVREARRAELVQADFHLHKTIIRLAGHSRLVPPYQAIEKQTLMFFVMAGEFVPLQDYIDLHEELVRAIKAGDPDEAEKVASSHNTADGEALVRKLHAVEVGGNPADESAASGARFWPE